jgi:hypothetical protein
MIGEYLDGFSLVVERDIISHRFNGSQLAGDFLRWLVRVARVHRTHLFTVQRGNNLLPTDLKPNCERMIWDEESPQMVSRDNLQ